MSIFGTLVTPDDVRQEQQRLFAAVQGTNSSVAACTKIDPVMRAAWNQFYSSVISMITVGPTFWGAGGDMDQTQKREAELFAWQQKLATVCTISMPIFDPSAQQNPDTQAFVQLARYLTIGVSVVAGAYVVSKLVALIPPRTSTPELPPPERRAPRQLTTGRR